MSHALFSTRFCFRFCFCCFTTGVLNILFATGENITLSSSTAVLLVVRRVAFVDRLGVFAVGVLVRALSFVIQPRPRPRRRLRLCDTDLLVSNSHLRILSSQTFAASASFFCEQNKQAKAE